MSQPSTPSKRYVQKDILTTPRSAARAKIKGMHGTADFIRPVNWDDEVQIDDTSPLFGQTIQVGNSYFTYGKNMAEYKDSTQLYRSKDRVGLLARLESDGYILIRGAIEEKTAQTCRETLINHLHSKGAIDTSKGPLSSAFIKNTELDGWTVDAETGGFVNNRESEDAVEGWREIGWCPEVRNVYAGNDINAVYRFLWGQERNHNHGEDGYVALTHNTWLRAKAKGEITSEHADYYYFKKNTTTFQEHRHPHVITDAEKWNDEHPLPTKIKKSDIIICDVCLRHFDGTIQVPKASNWDKTEKGDWHCHECSGQYTPFYTCWISLGEYSNSNSSLCMMPCTQGLIEFDKPLRTDLLPADYNQLVKDKWGWLRSDFGLGDIVIFNWKTVHGASKNTMTQFRFSIDTRICSEWIRPKGLYGEQTRLTYNYPQNSEESTDKLSLSGAVDTIALCPSINNPLCPTKVENLDEINTKVQRRRKIGNISSKPKIQGSDDENDEEESDYTDEEEKSSQEISKSLKKPSILKVPRKQSVRTMQTITTPVRRSARIQNSQQYSQNSQDDANQFVQLSLYGADDVERYEIPFSQTETDYSDNELSKCGKKKQHRILREKDALLLQHEIPLETTNRQLLDLSAISEERQCDLDDEVDDIDNNNNININNNILNDDDINKKLKMRTRQSDSLQSDCEDNDNFEHVAKKQRLNE